MPLADPFKIRVDTVRIFLELPPLRLLALRYPSDLELVVSRLLARLDEDPDNPHVFMPLEVPFAGYRAFFQAILDEASIQARAAASTLREVGIEVPPTPSLPPLTEDRDDPEEIAEFVRPVAGYLSALADALGDDVGALCFVLRSPGAARADAFRWSVKSMAEALRSDWAKLLVLDEAGTGALDGIQGESAVAMGVDFAVSPAEIMAELAADLDGDDMAPGERRRHLLLAGAMASSQGRPEEARVQLTEAVTSARSEGASGEEANALFNLGNLELEAGGFEVASEHFGRAAALALEAESDALAAMALTNLGVSLHREGRSNEALDAFSAAWKLFAALNFRPGQAHVLDCTARAYALGGDDDKARQLWGRAREVYRSIEAPHLMSLRAGGESWIESQLGRLRPASGG